MHLFALNQPQKMLLKGRVSCMFWGRKKGGSGQIMASIFIKKKKKKKLILSLVRFRISENQRAREIAISTQ